MMNDSLIYLLDALAGGALGLVFYGGLWATVRHSVASEHPALLFIGSMILRTVVVLGGIWLIAVPHWDRMLSLLLGFVLARVVMTRWTAGQTPRRITDEVGDAPHP